MAMTTKSSTMVKALRREGVIIQRLLWAWPESKQYPERAIRDTESAIRPHFDHESS